MINARLVREQDALLQFEVMAWLIRQYGSPPRPPVPSPLHKAPGLETLVWDPQTDSRDVHDWADDSFGEIKSNCFMDDWHVALTTFDERANPDDTVVRYEQVINRRNSSALFYDPRDCADRGHFAARAILRLAEMRTGGFYSEAGLSPLMEKMVTLTSACYSRQGFVLSNLPEHVSAFLTSQSDARPVPHRIVMNVLCFSTCLALRVRRQSCGQILATYGTRMPKAFRKKVRQACRQIDSFDQELKLLQVMADPTPQRAARPAQILARA